MVYLVAAEIVGEKVAAVCVRPVVTEVEHRAHVGMAAVNGVGAFFPSSPGAVVVSGGGQEIIAETGIVARRVGNDMRRVVGVGLVPEDAALDNMGDAAAAKVAPAMGHEDCAVLVV